MARSILDQQRDRLHFGELLMPKDDYELDYAVGLTYSLDLEALLGVPVSLGMLGEIDTIHNMNPYLLLEAIRRSSDKIAIFCNAGSMKLPQHILSVYALLEKSVFEVLLPQGEGSRRANFHPKLWVLKYSRSKNDSYIKVITLSRNLTFDNSFDVAVELTGIVGKTLQPRNRPLVDMLRYVAGYASNSKESEIEAIAKAIMRADLHSIRDADDAGDAYGLGDDFEDYAFHPFGIQGYMKRAMPLLIKPGSGSALIVSPFISKEVAGSFNAIKGLKVLVTRLSELDNDLIKLFDEVYVARDEVMTNEIIQEDSQGVVLSDDRSEDYASETALTGENAERNTFSMTKRDIHAKMYLIKDMTGRQPQDSFFVGSLNATNNAFYHNVEFLLELKCKPASNISDVIYRDVIAEGKGAFERVYEVDETEEKPGDSKTDFSDILYAELKAVVTSDNGQYTVRISIQGAINAPAEIAPLYKESDIKALIDGVEFTALKLTELSLFYVIKRENTSIVIKIPTAGFPGQERDDAIFKDIIGNKNEFMKYVAFMLTDDYAEAIIETEGPGDGSGDSETGRNNIPIAVYENLLRTAARKPERLDAVGEIITMFDEEIVANEFRDLLETVRTATRKGRRHE